MSFVQRYHTEIICPSLVIPNQSLGESLKFITMYESYTLEIMHINDFPSFVSDWSDNILEQVLKYNQ